MQGVDTPHLVLKPLGEPDMSLLHSPACTICTTPPRYWSLLMGPSKPYNHVLPLGYILEVFEAILTADVWAYIPFPMSNFEPFVLPIDVYGSLEFEIAWH